MAIDPKQGPNAAQAENWHGRDGTRWARHKAPHDAMLAELTQKAFDAVGFKPGQRVLDLGCGSGTTTFEIAKLVGPSGSVTGVDFSEPLLALAREQAASEPDLPVTFEFADVETHAFAPESFDLAFSRPTSAVPWSRTDGSPSSAGATFRKTPGRASP
jgi:SAM-dependent methyltransferase